MHTPVDSAELAGILSALSWKITVIQAHVMVEKIAVKPNPHGLFLLNEEQFIAAMLSGQMKALLEELQATDRINSTDVPSRKSSTKRMSLIASKLIKTKNVLSSHDQLIKWTLRKNIVANSLSGATQLLMLAHTPVSRKVFQFFDCNNLAGKHLLRADYNVNCKSDEYFRFMVMVIFVLLSFVIALPGIISCYLWYNRKELYSTSIFQTVGWLYDPFVRGAEFWQVHDVMMKMILTGMLIYVPPTSRAGIAVLVCVIACCNLNFFRPHKNKILFWLTQLSFITTATKYVMALLLSADSIDEQDTISTLLISIDIFFMSSSVIAIVVTIWVLRKRIKEIQKEKKNQLEDGGDGNNNPSVIIDPNAEPTVGNETNQSFNDFSTFAITGQSNASRTQIQPVTPRRASIARIRSSRSQIVHDIHEEHRKSQMNLDINMQMKARKQRRKTQLRVKARAKLKKQKVLTRIPAFASLTEPEIDAMLEVMTREQHVKDEVLCQQGDVADTFYIVMSGECAAYGKKPGEALTLLGNIHQFQFFGEASLLSDLDVEDKRKAMVKVESEVLTVMVLTKKNFYGLIDGGRLNKNVLDGVKKVDLARQEQNMK